MVSHMTTKKDHHVGENCSVADELSRRVRVLCLVMTYPRNHRQKADHVLATWGKRCNKVLFMTSEEGWSILIGEEELDDPVVSALRRVIAEVKQRCSVIEYETKNLLCRALPCFGRLVKPLVPAAFAVVSIHFSFKKG
jgi:hypothetical protein